MTPFLPAVVLICPVEQALRRESRRPGSVNRRVSLGFRAGMLHDDWELFCFSHPWRSPVVTFQPFPFRCITCATPFRVTKAELVGAIVACPKCGSMMQIQAPDTASATAAAPPRPDQQQLAIGSSNVDSEAITQGSAILAGDEPPPAASAPALPPGRRFEVDQSIDQASDQPVAAPPQLISPNDPAAWQSSQTVRRRQIAMVAVVSISGLVIAGLLFWLFVESWNRQEPTTAQPSTSSPPATVQPASTA